jgi:methylenetetrahydrofolate dehydrogenase (NADP+) / methenyltetrahydrofolate cyclohydrolase
MTAILMDGRALATEVKARVAGKAKAMIDTEGVQPRLATILVGDDAPSEIYVAGKHKAAQEVGIGLETYHLPGTLPTEELAVLIRKLNADAAVNGILLQLPLPSHLDARSIIDLISPEKDVDGLTAVNVGRLFYGRGTLVPCTPKGIMELLRRYEVPLAGSRCAIINRSALVGRPLMHLLLGEDATVTVCHSRSRDLASLTREADIVVSAVGRRPHFSLTKEMIGEGAVVIDVGMNRLEGKLVGDAEFSGVAERASMITPVPGGVGPMTVAMLMENTLIAASMQIGRTKRESGALA